MMKTPAKGQRSGGSVMLWGRLSVADTVKLVIAERRFGVKMEQNKKTFKSPQCKTVKQANTEIITR